MRIHLRVSCIFNCLVRYNSKLSKFRSDAMYGDELIQKKITVLKKSRKINPARIIKPCQEVKSYSHFPELSVDDPKFRYALAVARGHEKAGFNPNNRTIVLEGSRLIRDAIKSGGKPLYLLFSARDVLQEVLQDDELSNVYFMPHRALKQYSQLKTSPGILAIVQVPAPMDHSGLNTSSSVWKPLPATLIVDQVRDPGNLGSLLRTAAGFGLSSVLVSKGSVDIWNEKVIRAGMSAHFRVPIYPDLDWSDIGRYLGPLETGASGLPRVFVADIATKHSDQIISSAQSEPLHTNTTLGDDVGDIESDQDELETENEPLQLDSTQAAFRLPLTMYPHFAVNFFLNSSPSIQSSGNIIHPGVALIVGGEAHGLSPEAYHLAHLTGGSRIYVPCSPETESLNVLSAASAILGEMQRQYIVTS